MSSSEYVFLGILEQTKYLSAQNIPELMSLENTLYQELSAHPDNVIGLTAMMNCQILLGNISKAKALAHKIWSIGGEILEVVEASYLDALVNLGLIDMAMALLKPRLSDLRNIGIFSKVTTKLAILTGNLSVIEKIYGNQKNYELENLVNLIQAYQELNYTEHFRHMQKMIFDYCKNYLAAYRYNVYIDRGFTDLESHIYVIVPDKECETFSANLNEKINAYCISSGIKRLNNYNFVIENVSHLPSYYK